MELRPGRCVEMSPHFMLLPRSWMSRASSSRDHLLCFFAGDSAVRGGKLRFPVVLLGCKSDPAASGSAEPGATETLCLLAPAPPTTPRGDGPAATAKGAGGGPLGGAVTAALAGNEADGGCRAGHMEDPFGLPPSRSEAISIMSARVWWI